MFRDEWCCGCGTCGRLLDGEVSFLVDTIVVTTLSFFIFTCTLRRGVLRGVNYYQVLG